MSSSSYIASDLSGLSLKYIEKHTVDAPDMKRELVRTHKNASARLSYERWCGCMTQLIELTGNPCIGIDMGELMEPSYCGVLGHLALSCGTLAESFARFARYQELLYESTGQLTLVGNKYRFSWQRESEELFDTQQSDEILLVGLLKLAKHLTGKSNLKPHRVGFMHSSPDYAAKYKKSLGSHIEFNQPELFVELSIELLSHPINNSNPTLIRLLDQQADALLKALPNRGEFEVAIRKSLVECLQNGTPSLDALSIALGISSRTLHRRLESRGLNFSLLLQKTRYELAVQYLREKRLSVVDIGFLLGYSEQSAFARAFKQWTGRTPRQFK